MSAVLATMLSRLHAKDPMSVDELLNPLDENTTAEDPTDEDFCGVGDQRLAEDGSEAGSESPGQDMERSIKKDFELEAVKEHIMWIDKLLVRAGATGVSDISVSRLREMQRSLHEKLGRTQGQRSLLDFFGCSVQL
ncbi:hypothetical protein F441_08930 [Phytophthora nicotianae CJ01A1]|uniref:Uncharacterized protein n=1 Tax=Phytophthora nicotianae CJ01A1 TaxID=1317063 RepID=W2X107_PHYNI|nr:hypothetical protein F441_08930 [Phytophthora nicotianae CJ01A1]